jgi:hypothetical protein
MNFDDLKNSYQSLGFNGDENVNISFTRKVEGVVEKVRKEDRRDKQRLSIVSILLVGIGLMYSIRGTMLYINNPNSSEWWGFALYVLAIISVMPVMIFMYQQIRRVNYDAPVVQFIGDVEKRYALFRPYKLWVIPFLVLADASIIYIMANGRPLTLNTMLQAQIPLVIGLTVGLIIGVGMWYNKKLPILEELRSIRKSMEG